MIRVEKRDGTTEYWNPWKVQAAVLKAGASADTAATVAEIIESQLEGEETIGVEPLQDLVEEALMALEPQVAKSYLLYRADRSRLRKGRLKPDVRALAEYIHYSKYSRYREDLGRRETWAETVDRRMQMDLRKFPYLETEIREVYDEFVQTKKVLPSMRSIQFGGLSMERNNLRGYNCAWSLVDRPRVFSEVFFLLLSGCGVGFSVQRSHVKRLPALTRPDRSYIHTHTIEDSIEGWAVALETLIDSYMSGSSSFFVEFDYSEIRPEGALIQTSGGRAPGHIPLKRMLEQVRASLDLAVGRQLRPIEAHDILCQISDAVLAGGIRRSALISIFSPDDTEMLLAKTGDFRKTHPWRERANNSAAFVRGDTNRPGAKDQFDRLFQHNREWGDPGFLFTPHEDWGINPCGEIGLNPVCVKTGETGFGLCNLTTINATKVEDKADLIACARAAAFLGTLQAAYTDFPYLTPATKRIVEREALLGVSMTGVMDNPVTMDPANQRAAALAAVAENLRVAPLIGIRTAARVTTNKPEGTSSLLLSDPEPVSAGVHAHHARRYIRRVTANPLEPCFEFFKKTNPHMCVPLKWSKAGDWCIEFPIEVRDDAILRDDLTGIEFVKQVCSIYENWILPGTANPWSSSGLTHNVSATTTVRPDEWDQVRDFVWENRSRIAAMSFLAYSGDKDWEQPPCEGITTPADEARWNEIISRYRQVEWTEMRELEDRTSLNQVIACEGPKCQLEVAK